jgi:hypothetical protein
MIRRFVPDIVGVCLIAIVAVLLAVRPDGKPDFRPQAASQGVTQKAPAVRQERQDLPAAAIADDAVKKRNVFAASGSYAATGTETVSQPADNTYVLIGILGGTERKAVFRDGQGAVAAFAVGKTMGDGFVIAGIDNVSVKFIKGKETKELKIFNVQYKPPKR